MKFRTLKIILFWCVVAIVICSALQIITHFYFGDDKRILIYAKPFGHYKGQRIEGAWGWYESRILKRQNGMWKTRRVGALYEPIWFDPNSNRVLWKKIE